VTLEGWLYVDAEVTVTTSPDVLENISADPLDTLHVSPLGSPPSHSPKCHNLSLVACHDILKGNEIDCMDSLSPLRGYDSSLDPYSLYLGSMPL